MSARRILVLHGPNLNLLPGERSVEAIDAALFARAVALGVELKTVQSNWEGGLLDTLAAEREWFEAVIINPAALAPSALALAEALRFLKRPAIEVQLDEVKKGRSALKGVVEKQISGKGPAGYLEALVALAPKGGARLAPARPDEPAPPPTRASKSAARPEPAPPKKSLGARTVDAALEQARPPAPKTLGRPARPEDAVGRVLPSGEVIKSLGGKPARAQLGARPPAAPSKSVGGRRAPSGPAPGVISRAAIRQQIADRLAGTQSPSGLAAWARSQWQKLQSGAPSESGQQDKLDDVLQQLLLSASMTVTDDQLIELMTQLGD